MSFKVVYPGGKREDHTTRTGYKVLPSGALQIVELAEGSLPRVIAEYGPTGWIGVEGTRVIDNTDNHQGLDGKIANHEYRQQS